MGGQAFIGGRNDRIALNHDLLLDVKKKVHFSGLWWGWPLSS